MYDRSPVDDNSEKNSGGFAPPQEMLNLSSPPFLPPFPGASTQRQDNRGRIPNESQWHHVVVAPTFLMNLLTRRFDRWFSRTPLRRLSYSFSSSSQHTWRTSLAWGQKITQPLRKNTSENKRNTFLQNIHVLYNSPCYWIDPNTMSYLRECWNPTFVSYNPFWPFNVLFPICENPNTTQKLRHIRRDALT